MHKILLSIVLLSSALFSLEWVKDVPTAFAVAQKEHKNVMVFVESQTCRWCKKMKYRTFSDEAVQKRLESFVLVKVMSEDADATKYLPAIQGAPTTFFMKENKEVLQEVLGYFNAEDFIAYINDAQSKTK
jgi:thioredoxin-related protein